MKLTNTDALRICLLFFVCASIVVLAAKAIIPVFYRAQTVTVAEAELGPDRVIVYSTHAKVRCPTCTKMEELTKKTLDSYFKNELDAKQIEWKELDYELPENATFAARHKIATATVLLVRIQGGKETDSKNNVADAWALVGDEPKFMETFTQHIRDFFDQSPSQTTHDEPNETILKEGETLF